MAKPLAKDHPRMLELAKRGAQAQLNDLLHEIDMLLELFPHLRDSFDADELPVQFLLKRGSDRAERKQAVASARARSNAGRGAPERRRKS